MGNTPDHKDVLGRQLAVGDCIVFSSYNTMYVGTVIKLNPKMVKVKRVGNNGRNSTYNKYPQDLARVDGPEVTMYLLQKKVDTK